MSDFNQNFDALGVEVAHHFGGGVYAKETVIPAGRVLSQHAHAYAHLSILARGTALVEVGGESREVSGPCCLTIAAGALHRVTSLTPVVWFCIHRSDVTDPALIDETIIEGA